MRRQRSVPLGSGSSSVVGDTMREGSASADRGESRGTCSLPDGAAADERKGMRQGRDRPKRVKAISDHPPLAIPRRANARGPGRLPHRTMMAASRNA